MSDHSPFEPERRHTVQQLNIKCPVCRTPWITVQNTREHREMLRRAPMGICIRCMMLDRRPETP